MNRRIIYQSTWALILCIYLLILPFIGLSQTPPPLYSRYGVSTTVTQVVTDDIIFGVDQNGETDLDPNRINIIMLGDGYGNMLENLLDPTWQDIVVPSLGLSDQSPPNDLQPLPPSNPLYKFLYGSTNNDDGVFGFRNALFTTEPYMQYRNFFHLIAVFVDNTNYPSEDNGTGVNEPCADPGVHCEYSGLNYVAWNPTCGPANVVYNHWGSTFDYEDLHRYQRIRDQPTDPDYPYSDGIVIGKVQGADMFDNFDEDDLTIVVFALSNVGVDRSYGGGSAQNVVSPLNSSIEVGISVTNAESNYFQPTAVHEFSHSFGELMDEYFYEPVGGFPPGFEAPNMTQAANGSTPWENWMGLGPIGTETIGHQEHKKYVDVNNCNFCLETTPTTGWYMPYIPVEGNSSNGSCGGNQTERCMMQGQQDYCLVCKEAVVEMIHETLIDDDVIGVTTPAAGTTLAANEALEFSLPNVILPDPNTM